MPWDKTRTITWLAISILITVVGSVLLWNIFPGALFGFLFLPFLPFAFGRRRRSDAGSSERTEPLRRTCPRCGFVGRAPEDRFCPRDGSPLV